MAIRLEYSPLPGNKTVLTPLLPVTLINSINEFPTLALVDSGATAGSISTVIADALGVKWRKVPRKIGTSVSGSFIFHPVRVEIDIFDNRFPLTINVVEGISPFHCILGQADLFQRAKITFERYKYQFEISFRRYD